MDKKFGRTAGKSAEKVQKESSWTRNLDVQQGKALKKSKEGCLRQEIWTYSLKSFDFAHIAIPATTNLDIRQGKASKRSKSVEKRGNHKYTVLNVYCFFVWGRVKLGKSIEKYNEM